MIGAFPPERAVTTHPSVVRAAILLVQEAGGYVSDFLAGDEPDHDDGPVRCRRDQHDRDPVQRKEQPGDLQGADALQRSLDRQDR